MFRKEFGLSASLRLVEIRSTGHDSVSIQLERRDGTSILVESALTRDAGGKIRHLSDSDLIADEFVGTAPELTAIFGVIIDFCLVAQEEHPQQIMSRESFLAEQASRPHSERDLERKQIAEVIRRLDGMQLGGSASSVLQAVQHDIGLENLALRQALLQMFSSFEGHRNRVDSIVWLWSVPNDFAAVDGLFDELMESQLDSTTD